MSIQDIASKIKSHFTSENWRDMATISIIILVGIVSFYLGRLSVERPPETTINTSNADTTTTSTYHSANSKNTTSTAVQLASDTATGSTGGGAYVASKNGTKYYVPSCSGANRILDANKIWFNSKEEAESAGYSQSTTCKGY